MLSALLLKRVDEQKKRIDVERINIVNEWTSHLYRTWEVVKSNIGDPLEHRLREHLRHHILLRPDYLKVKRSSQLWTLPMSDLVSNLNEIHPHQLNLEHLTSEFDSLFRIPEDFARIGDTNDDTENNKQPGEFDAHDSEGEIVDEEERDKQVDMLFRHLSEMEIDPDRTLPPAQTLINEVDGISPMSNSQLPVSSTLPSVRVLIDTVDGRRTEDTPLYNFFAEGISAEIQNPLIRVNLSGNGSRYYDDFEIGEDILKTLDDGRHINMTLVPILAKLLSKEVDDSRLSRAAPDFIRPLCHVINIRWDELTIKMIMDIISVSKTSFN